MSYKEMYLTLFRAITDAIELFQKCQPKEAVALLKAALWRRPMWLNVICAADALKNSTLPIR